MTQITSRFISTLLNAWLALDRPLFIRVIGILVLFVTLGFALTFQIESAGYDERVIEHEMAHVERKVSVLSSRLNDIESDLHLVADNAHLNRYLKSGGQPELGELASDFSVFIKAKSVYDQARFIDESGMERVRVDLAPGAAVVIPPEKLQNKGSRYFFTDTMKLDAGKVFISPFDLNIEGKRVEMPFKPMIRLATPLFDAKGERRGIAIINYLGNDLLQRLNGEDGAESTFIELLNRDGFWLKSKHPEDEWGFMFDSKKTFATEHPDIWRRMQGMNAGQVQIGRELWTWARIHPLRDSVNSSTGTAKAAGNSASAIKASDYYWIAVSRMNMDIWAPDRRNMLLRYAALWLGAFSLVVFVSWMIAAREGELLTARRAAESAERKTALLLTSAGEGIFGVDQTGNTTFVNPAARQMFGWAEDEGLGVDLHGQAHHHHVDGSPYLVEECPIYLTLQDGMPRKIDDDCYWRKDGSAFSVEYTTTPIKDGDRIIGAVNVFRDISSRKETEATLWEAKERLEAAASAGIVGIWDWDVPKNRLFWDKVMYKLYGLQQEDFSGAYEAWESALHPDDKFKANEEINAALSGEREYSTAFRVVWPDGSIRHIKAVGHTTFDDHGKPLRMIGVNYDVTEEKNLEQMLEEGVALRTQELYKARQAAEVANVAKSAFLANMGHEMRTPLHHITSLAQLVRRDPLSPRQTEYIEKLNTSCSKLTAIINTILELTRIEAGQFDVVEAPFSVTELLEQIFDAVRDSANEKHIALQAEVIGIPEMLYGSRSLLHTALSNYVSNAIRFTEAGSVTVRLKLLMEVGRELLIRFEVEDTGIGISPEDQARLFSIFEQVDMSSTRKFGGIGLGLAMTKKLAEIMGGTAGCESQEGKGSTFWFSVRQRKVA